MICEILPAVREAVDAGVPHAAVALLDQLALLARRSDRDGQILALRAEGLMAPAIAERMKKEGWKITAATVNLVLKSKKKSAKRGRPLSVEAQDRAQKAAALAAQGKTIAEIAAEFEVSERTIKNDLTSVFDGERKKKIIYIFFLTF